MIMSSRSTLLLSLRCLSVSASSKESAETSDLRLLTLCGDSSRFQVGGKFKTSCCAACAERLRFWFGASAVTMLPEDWLDHSALPKGRLGMVNVVFTSSDCDWGTVGLLSSLSRQSAANLGDANLWHSRLAFSH